MVYVHSTHHSDTWKHMDCCCCHVSIRPPPSAVSLPEPDAHLPPSSSASTQFSICALVRQLWRLVTNVGFLAGFSPHFAIRMIWLCVYSPVLERTMTEYNPGEFAYFMLFSLLTLDVMGMFSPLSKILFTAGPLVFTIMYLWSREFASQDVSIYGLVRH